MMQMTNGDKAQREYIGGQYYQDSVTIVNKGVEMFYQKVLTILTCLDLSNNSFHGRIPEEIQVLMSLRVLNLSHNSFSGKIPSALDNLKDLESLDLSQNKLSREIPPQLASLTFLAALDLSYNQLEGSIPQSNQFSTFTNDSYQGNPKLCGPPLSRKCNLIQGKMKKIHVIVNDVEMIIDGRIHLRSKLKSSSSRLMLLIQTHITMINGLGIAGWGDGGTETDAAMLNRVWLNSSEDHITLQYLNCNPNDKIVSVFLSVSFARAKLPSVLAAKLKNQDHNGNNFNHWSRKMTISVKKFKEWNWILHRLPGLKTDFLISRPSFSEMSIGVTLRRWGP
ncbi:leucine-rich repeat receptor-like kinase protein CLV1a [Hibiscus syriacus]|uniref:leucine-rich repeat receptor-like kinase protein CLV1a n=1 Tax=Hibiscus syriacus TaxID=106335 RepID=UPI0019250827|nr:leucine-rich repeat receptor-like kinase protein CLV1a [Hibiscus syriacus]